MVRKLSVAALAVGVAVVTGLAVMRPSDAQIARPPKRYLPEYTATGDLKLPNDFHHWVFVGSPLTPNALNDGQLSRVPQRLHRAGVLRGLQADR
jgi:hypothetical protein